jgi:DNA polymerase/3'-5' exonuclease PolX
VTAQELAQKLLEYLRPSCERIEIAGSIRRGKPNPKDIELVLIPTIETVNEYDLLGAVINTWQDSYFDAVLSELIQTGTWEFDTVLKRNGPKYKRIRHKEGICADIFLTTAEQWGVQFTIRTGTAEFSHQMVTRALHLGMKVENGRLWKFGETLYTPEELDFFAALGVRYVEPNNRVVLKIDDRLSVPLGPSTR